MQYEHSVCQLPHSRTGDSPQKSTPQDGTQCPPAEFIRVPDTHQWISTTAGRIAPDPYSWMQAVHWIGGSGLYTPSRTHGPRWGDTTIRLAQELSALKECRPGIAYLARKLGASERTVQYHLDMLREAGLLAYRFKGSRVTGSIRQASEFERIIPLEFDTALGIRTVGEGVQRRPAGIAEEHRSTIGKLAKKAARKVRRKRSKKPSSARSRCTPMQVGTSSSSPDGGTHSPSESKLASGSHDSPTPKKPKRAKRTLNRVGRRYQVARELIQQVGWLAGASTPRIAWIVKDVADAGWTAAEVIAWLDTTAEPEHGARRPSGLLAHRLQGVTGMPGWQTPAQRAAAVERMRDSRHAEHQRHDRTTGDWSMDNWQQPDSRAARRIYAQAMADVRRALQQRQAPVEELFTIDTEAPQAARIEDFSRELVVDMRAAAEKDPAMVLVAIDSIGERDARRLYTNRLVDQTLGLEAISVRRNTLAPAF
ncbi:winged helix-turn-helix domain-containing protein [Streptomyces sp. NPDC021098]|uniref:helix-turn-helix domain-containing protein n=1 Tax=unclassified Streptomyces TaxID=2593676 RepID=UPI0037A549F0